MPQDLVTLQEVKVHLGLDGTTGHEANLQMKLTEATVLVVDYVRQRAGTTEARAEWYAIVDGWTDETVPEQIRTAIFKMVGHLWAFRGDNDKSTAREFPNGDLPPDVTMFLKRLRDVAIA